MPQNPEQGYLDAVGTALDQAQRVQRVYMGAGPVVDGVETATEVAAFGEVVTRLGTLRETILGSSSADLQQLYGQDFNPFRTVQENIGEDMEAEREKEGVSGVSERMDQLISAHMAAGALAIAQGLER